MNRKMHDSYRPFNIPTYRKVQGDQKVSMHLTITAQNNPHTTDELKMAITENIWNVDCAILNTIFENMVRSVNKYLETGMGHFEHYLQLSVL